MREVLRKIVLKYEQSGPTNPKNSSLNLRSSFVATQPCFLQDDIDSSSFE